MKVRSICSAVVSAACLAPGAASATNGYFANGYGIRSMGMAGVGIAFPQDALASAINPAGMTAIGSRVDLGVSYFRPDREAEIVGNGGIPPMGVPSLNGKYDGNDKAGFWLPEVGYNRMVRPDLALGLAVYGNGGMNTSYGTSPFARLGGSSPAGVDLAQVFVAPSVAWKVNERHSIGATVNLIYQRFSAEGLQPFGAMSSNPANVTNNGNDTSTGWNVRVGWMGQVTDTVTLGATYQSKARMGKFDRYSGLFASQGMFDIPANWGVGVAWKAAPKWTVAADVQQIEYSGVESIANPMNTGKPLGTSGGPGFGWRDMTVFKVGTAFEATPGWTVRAGYSHGRQPIPASETFFNVLAPGVIEDHLTLGLTWTMHETRELSFAYMHGFSKTVNGDPNSIPFGGGAANLKMHQDVFGAALALKF